MRVRNAIVAAATIAAIAIAYSGPPTGPPPTTHDGVTEEITFAWNPNPETDIAGYRLHWGADSGVYLTSVDVGNVTTGKLDLPVGGDSFTVVTAYNTSGLESLPSNEVRVDLTPPGAPAGLFAAPAANP
jgi:hypothetical protein